METVFTRSSKAWNRVLAQPLFLSAWLKPLVLAVWGSDFQPPICAAPDKFYGLGGKLSAVFQAL